MLWLINWLYIILIRILYSLLYISDDEDTLIENHVATGQKIQENSCHKSNLGVLWTGAKEQYFLQSFTI